MAQILAVPVFIVAVGEHNDEVLKELGFELAADGSSERSAAAVDVRQTSLGPCATSSADLDVAVSPGASCAGSKVGGRSPQC